MSKFIITSVNIKDRHIEPTPGELYRLKKEGRLPLKSEALVLEVSLVSSGDTRVISNEFIMGEVMKRLAEIEDGGLG